MNSRMLPSWSTVSLLRFTLHRIKIFEKLFGEELCRHSDYHNLLSTNSLVSDHFDPPQTCLLPLPRDWQDALDNGLDTLVIALDIMGAFYRVWHRGLLKKNRAKEIEGNLLLLADYLRGRTLRVVINGQTSRDFPFEALVPRGSVLMIAPYRALIPARIASEQSRE
ncbi:uncharacterized protein LOC121854718 [Homarus americanus]|uniref:uncharacterized protein LOC121854718 n=1 Tax=Homarus americanus TaxID=6706 RepID=UPI001C44EDA8|nr:uncharacterized protein LOC121854718 [Homarus americanus]